MSKFDTINQENADVKLSLHSVILGQPLSFEDLLALAAKLGYEGVDAGFDYALNNDPGAYLELCAKHNVYGSIWGHGVEWRKDEDTFRAGMEQLPGRARLAAEVNCTRTTDWIMPAVEGDAQEALGIWKRRWADIARVIGEHGHRLGLEWVGPQHLREGKTPTVWRMDQLLEIEDEIGAPNLGLLVDSFHWFNAEHTVAALEALPAEKVVHVHLNDAPDRPLADQRDPERLTPGEGIIDLVGFLSALKKIGYADYMGVEIFSADLKAMPVEQAAGHVKRACDALLAQVR